MRVIASRATWVNSMSVAMLTMLFVLSSELCAASAGKGDEIQGVACEVKGCKCIAALISQVNAIAQRLSVAQRISGRLIVSKLVKLKRLYGSNFSMHGHATSLLAWLNREPMCIFATEPFDGEPTAFPGDGVLIYGAVESGAVVTVNGTVAPLDERGRFAVIAGLKPNGSCITISVAKGGLKKEWKVSVPVKLDKRLDLLDELCKRAEEFGMRLEGARTILNEALRRASTGQYGRRDAKRLDEIIGHVKVSLIQHRLSMLAGSSCAQLRALWEIARTFVAAGDINRAELILEQLEAYRGADPNDVPCKVEPVLRDRDWCYSISNGYMSAVLSRRGGRVVELRSFGIPMLGEDGITDDLGDEAGRRDWVLIVEHASDESVLLRAHTFVGNEVEVSRVVSLVKGSPLLMLHYCISNQAQSDVASRWRLLIHPAIGYKDGGGNPMWDTLFMPSSEHPRIVISTSRSGGAFKRIPLKPAEDVVGAYDSAYKAGLGIIFDRKVFNAHVLYDGSRYAFELSLNPSHSANSQKGKVEFALSVAVVMGCESYRSFGEALRTIAMGMRDWKTTPLIGRPK